MRRGVPSSGNTNDEAKTLVSNLQSLAYENGSVSGGEITELWTNALLARDFIKACLSRNICAFNKKTYKFPDGLPMGGPPSALVADFYMAHLEDIISSSPLSSPSAFWAKYVDDILRIWTESGAELDHFSSFLNSLRPSIDFTLEQGSDSIPCLDLNIRLVRHSSNLITQFTIFRKMTFTGVFIHSSERNPCY